MRAISAFILPSSYLNSILFNCSYANSSIFFFSILFSGVQSAGSASSTSSTISDASFSTSLSWYTSASANARSPLCLIPKGNPRDLWALNLYLLYKAIIWFICISRRFFDFLVARLMKMQYDCASPHHYGLLADEAVQVQTCLHSYHHDSALGTFTPTSTTVVDTSTCDSLFAKRCMPHHFCLALHPAVKHIYRDILWQCRFKHICIVCDIFPFRVFVSSTRGQITYAWWPALTCSSMKL